VGAGAVVVVDASASVDEDGGKLSYGWACRVIPTTTMSSTSGSGSTSTGTTSSSSAACPASFTTAAALATSVLTLPKNSLTPGTNYLLDLTVTSTDGRGRTDSASVALTVVGNGAPTVVSGSRRGKFNVDGVLTLSGSVVGSTSR
jgi:hypothetical protein